MHKLEHSCHQCRLRVTVYPDNDKATYLCCYLCGRISPKVWLTTSVASYPKLVWTVSYPGKVAERFEHWWTAISFAIYVARHPHVMQDRKA